MKHVKLNTSISKGDCETSLLDQFNAIPIECQTECSPSHMKVEKLSASGELESEWGTIGFTFQEAYPSMSSSESSMSGMDTANMRILNEDDTLASNCGIEFQDVSFAAMVEADTRYSDYDLFSSFMSDVQHTADEEEKHNRNGVDLNRVPCDSSSDAWGCSSYATSSMIEFACSEESVKPVVTADRANIPAHMKDFNETRQRPVTYSLRPRAAASKAIPATSFEQSHPPSSHKKNGNVQTSCDDIKISQNAQHARINRKRKKAYIQGLESKMADMHKENTQLKSETLHLRRDKRSLENEVLYLKRVLANESALANLLRNIDSDGVVLSKSFENQRKRSLALDHDYGRPMPKYQRTGPMNDTEVKQASGGVCLHVDTGRVSLEFCSKCAHLASNISDDEEL